MGAFDSYDSAGTHKFGLTLDGIESKTIKKVDGLDVKIDKVETKSNNLQGQPVHKVWAGNQVFLGQLTATRVLTDDKSWAEWHDKAVKDVKSARKNGSVTIYNQMGMPARTFDFTNAWPIELKVTGLDAGSANPIEETVTFVYEEIKIS